MAAEILEQNPYQFKYKKRIWDNVSAYIIQRDTQRQFLDHVKHHAQTFAPQLAIAYNAQKKTDFKAANAKLAEFLDKAPRLKIVGGKKYSFYRKDLYLAGTNEDLDNFCAAKARHCQYLIRLLPDDQLAIALLDVVESYGIALTKKQTKQIRQKNMTARLTSEKWWRKKIKPIAFRTCEQIWREMGHTRRGRGAYVSDYTVKRFLSREARNRNLLETVEAVNQDGQAFTLAELADLSVSNPEIRRTELMVRLRGCEEWADSDGSDWQGMGYTLTAPSKYHLYSGDAINKKYNGATPRRVQAYLCNLWDRFRSWCDRNKIQYYGFRMVEPHHDGCPHWHLAIYVKKSQERIFTQKFRQYALEEDGNEPGAQAHRFDIEKIDKSRGSFAGYFSKYISKNIDGHQTLLDWEAQDFSAVSSIRVRAWAACWGIRQFQQLGGPGVGVWRELRRLANHPEQLPVEGKGFGTPEQLDLLLTAATGDDWGDYTGLMGGAVLPRVERPVSLFYRVADKLGQYGDEIRQIVGLSTKWFFFPLKSRVHNWQIELGRSLQRPAVQRVGPCVEGVPLQYVTDHLYPPEFTSGQFKGDKRSRINAGNIAIEKTTTEQLEYIVKAKQDNFWSTYIFGKKRAAK